MAGLLKTNKDKSTIEAVWKETLPGSVYEQNSTWNCCLQVLTCWPLQLSHFLKLSQQESLTIPKVSELSIFVLKLRWQRKSCLHLLLPCICTPSCSKSWSADCGNVDCLLARCTFCSEDIPLSGIAQRQYSSCSNKVEFILSTRHLFRTKWKQGTQWELKLM